MINRNGIVSTNIMHTEYCRLNSAINLNENNELALVPCVIRTSSYVHRTSIADCSLPLIDESPGYVHIFQFQK